MLRKLDFIPNYIWLIIGIILYFILVYFLDKKKTIFRQEFIAKSRYGRIEFVGQNSRNSTRFTLQGQEEINGIYLERDPIIEGENFNMYKIAEVGDSIAKDTNTAYLKLIKKNGEEIWFKMVEH